MDTIPAGYKFCNDCGYTRPRAEFHRNKSNKDGLAGQCKACVKEHHSRNRGRIAARKKEYRRENAEKILESERRYREENREALLESRRRHYQENAETERERARLYREANREKVNAAARRYDEKNRDANRAKHRERSRLNPERNRAYEAARRAAKKGNGGQHDESDVLAMYIDQGGLCAYCEAPLKGVYHADHMTPLSRGGSNGWENIAITCPRCNQRKHAKTVEEFWRYLAA